ncbi:Na(+) H(+) antiporter [Fusarium mundagurra]|uniref:Na(+) H(+) antiporter n=1 Tax=Fusarium mundagurra TaxID=1567541 RepID=A0A8H5YD44_9HYPO|nr:Na(+) H(+) antiporter [Fusarium mundagurra]
MQLRSFSTVASSELQQWRMLSCESVGTAEPEAPTSQLTSKPAVPNVLPPRAVSATDLRLKSRTGTGIIWLGLIGLGLLVLVFRRLPATFAFYNLIPDVYTNWKEAQFMGYFGSVGVSDEEETNLVCATSPIVYWLVLFPIIAPIQDDAVELRRISVRLATPLNAVAGDKDTFIAYNQFSRHNDPSAVGLPSNRSVDSLSDGDLSKKQKHGMAIA